MTKAVLTPAVLDRWLEAVLAAGAPADIVNGELAHADDIETAERALDLRLPASC